jgi:hypothetical protein
MFAVAVFRSIISQKFWIICYTAGMRLRTAVTGIVYRKVSINSSPPPFHAWCMMLLLQLTFIIPMHSFLHHPYSSRLEEPVHTVWALRPVDMSSEHLWIRAKAISISQWSVGYLTRGYCLRLILLTWMSPILLSYSFGSYHACDNFQNYMIIWKVTLIM